MEPYDPLLEHDLPAMFEALENHLEQATGSSQAVTMLRALLVILDPTQRLDTTDERTLLRRAVVVLTSRLAALELLDTLEGA
jgi:hypothetical protein